MTWTVLIDIDKVDEEDKIGDQMNKEEAPADKETEKTKAKTVFLIVYQAGSLDMLKGRLNKICDSFGASKYKFFLFISNMKIFLLRYGIPEDKTSFENKVVEVRAQLAEARNVILITKNQINLLLRQFIDPRIPV